MPLRWRPARRAAGSSPRSAVTRTAAAAGLAAGAALELPAAGGVLSGLAVAAAVRGRRHRANSGALATATLAGGAAALVTRRMWPVAPRTPAQIRAALTSIGAEPGADGEGLTVVVNRDSGPALTADPIDRLAKELPRAELVKVDGEEVPAALERAAGTARALGIAGGDGSVNAAAAVAHREDKPLLVVPSGTLNHLAAALGLAGVDDAIAAFRHGHTVAVDLGAIDGKPFLNTASLGSYTALVDAREQLESVIGKWPAMVVALGRILRRSEPLSVEIDGRRRSLWILFAGNCKYDPPGFAPSWRERLDDGQLDVRLVDASSPWARSRLLFAVLVGRLARCPAYEAFSTRHLEIRALDGPVRLARDGETFDSSGQFTICKAERPLAIYVPSSDEPDEPSGAAERR